MSDRIITQGTVYTGTLGSIGATALQLTATTRKLARGVRVRADDGNSTNFVYVGILGVTAGIAAPTTDGYKLKVSEAVDVQIDDPSKVYVIGSTTGLAVSWMAN